MGDDVKVLGFWSSPFVHRVIWALKLKGISYDYIEVERHGKSQLLLQSNPVYNKVPVLIHGANKPIAESLVILQYIEDTWPHNPLLLPIDVHERALARFWIKFGEDSISSIADLFLRPSKDDQERETSIKKAQETLTVIEEQGLGDKKFFGGSDINMVDIAYGYLSHWLEGLEEIAGMKLIEPNKFPRLHAWIQNFKQVPVIRKNLPDYGKLLVHLQWRRQQQYKIASITDLFLRPSKDKQERETSIKKAQETLMVIEEQGIGDKKFFGGNDINMVDIAYGCLSHWLEGLEEIVGMKLIESNKFPRLNAWIQNFKEVPVIRENLPDYEKLLVHLQWRRQQCSNN